MHRIGAKAGSSTAPVGQFSVTLGAVHLKKFGASRDCIGVVLQRIRAGRFTQNGGMNGNTGYGNVFSLTPSGGSWIYDDLYDFTGRSDGATPNGGLVGGTGDLFGTAQGGGNGIASAGDGVLFELRQEIAGNPYTLIVQHTFGGQPDGAQPLAGLYQEASTGTLRGTTNIGGTANLGTIFELYPDRNIVHDWHYLEQYSFAGGKTDGEVSRESAYRRHEWLRVWHDRRWRVGV